MEERTLSQQSRLELTHWWYAGRRAIVRSLLGEPPRGAIVLDAGSGPGGNRAILPQKVRCYAMDPARHSLDLSRAHSYAGWIQAGLNAVPLRTSSVDLVLAMDVLEHLDDDAGALVEIHRILKPGGRVLITVPAFRWLWGLQDRLSHHRRRYTRPELVHRVETAGFQVLRSTYFNSLLLPPIWLGRKILDRLPHSLESEGQITFPGLNGLLRWLFASERHLLRFVDLPAGVSVYCLARCTSEPQT